VRRSGAGALVPFSSAGICRLRQGPPVQTVS
jgi:hypothetical protein